MKKLSFIVSAFLFTCVCVHAQESREKIHLGIKAGVNISSMYDTKGKDYDVQAKAGFAGGGFLAIPMGKYLGIQPEVIFAQKGYIASNTSEAQKNYSYTRTTNHLEIPVLLQLKPVSFISIVGGPQFSYMTSREETFNTSNLTTTQIQEIKNDNIRRNTLGFTTGVDFYVLRYLLLSTRVGWDLQDNNGDGTASFPRYRNVWLQGAIGLRF